MYVPIQYTEKSEGGGSPHRLPPRLRQLHRAPCLHDSRAGRGRAGHRQSPKSSPQGHPGDRRLSGRPQVQGSIGLPFFSFLELSVVIQISEEASFHRRSCAFGDARGGGGGAGRTRNRTATLGSRTHRRCSPTPSSAAAAHASPSRFLEVPRRGVRGRKRKSRQQK